MRTNVTPPNARRTQPDFNGMTALQLELWQFANSAHWEEAHSGAADGIWVDYTGRHVTVVTNAADAQQIGVWTEFQEYTLAADGRAIPCPRVDRLWGGSGKVWFARPTMAKLRDGEGQWAGCRSAVQPLDDAVALHDADDLMSVMLRITATGTDH